MAEAKTRPTGENVGQFLNAITDAKKRQDSFTLLALMQQVTGLAPEIWASSMVGFGSYHYKYASGREGDAFLAGFAPRKQNLVIYIMPGFERYGALMEKLGKYKTGKSCLYINRLEDIDLEVLGEIIKVSVQHMRATNP